MRNAIALVAALSLAATSCSLFKTKLKVEEVVAEKVKIEETTNPAKKHLILNDLQKRRVVLNDVVVKKITGSTNIDYDFCIIADVAVGDKKIECHIYTKNVYKISNLKEGVSHVSVIGDFRRFFTMLDDYYTKIEIVQAKVTPLESAEGDKSEVKGKGDGQAEKNDASRQGGTKR